MKIGRPQANIDLNILKGLVGMHCTDKQIAQVFGITDRTLRNHKERPEVMEAYNDGKDFVIGSLKQKSLDHALNKGNITMLIFLLKNLCGMTENIQHSNDPENPIGNNITIELIKSCALNDESELKNDTEH